VVPVTEKELERCDPDVWLWKLASGIDARIKFADADTPVGIVALPDDLERRPD
jgi:hypothetical protein